METEQLLAVQNLSTHFFTDRGEIRAVDRLSLQVSVGEAVGLVGESGSGKSVMALSIMGLVPMPGRIVDGRILLRGKNLLELPEREIRQVRRHEIAMVFQDPSNYLNPILSVGEQIAEGIAEAKSSRKDVWDRVVAALEAVHIPEAGRVAHSYPHQLSGGMQQRVVIAAALIRHPSLVIADEPSTALDATVQYQILKLLDELRRTFNTAMILISHDLAVIATVCSSLHVMYAGQVFESGPTERIYRTPAHPYTKALLAAILDPWEKRGKALTPMGGAMPDLAMPPPGCRFHPRCPRAMEECSAAEPPEFSIAEGHTVKCWRYRP